MLEFLRQFGREPQATATAPGRVNLLGEHTDYNMGLVLPLAIARHVQVGVAQSPDGAHHFHSAQLGDALRDAQPQAAPGGFARYLEGCIEVLRSRGHRVPGILACVDSDVPIGAGLSSSAALEVATLRALRAMLHIQVDDEQIAHLAHEAETRHAGVNCGILDQMACSLAPTGQMLYLDTRSLERRLLPLPAGAELLVIDSGVSRSLAASGYNQRRAECEEAASLLGVASLRDVVDLPPPGILPAALFRRVRHVCSENDRVRQAVRGVDAARFGELMNASHASLSVDHEVSTPELDALAATLQADEDVYGAKLTGAGFGGAVVALVRAGCSNAVVLRVMPGYRADHPQARALLGV